MIKRTIFEEVKQSVKTKPVTLVTGARQVGKSTLVQNFIKDGFNYVSLDSFKEARMAQEDPTLFLSLHPWPLIIDEVQKAPQLFDVIEEIVNNEKMKNIHNYGMYILTGSQTYKLMKNVSQSMAGRVSIIHMLGLSRSEILGIYDNKFDYNLVNINQKAQKNPLKPLELYENIIKGSYPELFSNDNLKASKFYSDYVQTYIERDVSEIINIKDKYAFKRFIEVLASLTGNELVYDNLSKIVGVDIKTIQSWISILLAGDIIYLLEPYNENSVTKRVVKRPKIYFSDTGLACYLAKLTDPNVLRASAFGGSFVETYIINELRKNFINNGVEPNFYYYRDTNMNEIDLVILEDGVMHLVECKSGITFNNHSIKAFNRLENTLYKRGMNFVVCATNSIYPINENTYAIPIAGI